MKPPDAPAPAPSAEAPVAFNIPRWLLESALLDVSWSDPPTAGILRDILATTTEDPVRMQIVIDAAQRGRAAEGGSNDAD